MSHDSFASPDQLDLALLLPWLVKRARFRDREGRNSTSRSAHEHVSASATLRSSGLRTVAVLAGTHRVERAESSRARIPRSHCPSSRTRDRHSEAQRGSTLHAQLKSVMQLRLRRRVRRTRKGRHLDPLILLAVLLIPDLDDAVFSAACQPAASDMRDGCKGVYERVVRAKDSESVA